MMKFGLIGKTLKHSFSKKFFDEKFSKEGLDNSYELYEIDDISKLKELISRDKLLRGLNVTIPYKELVIPLLDKIEDGAREIGAVNTIKIFWIGENSDKMFLEGYNTDAKAFQQSLSAYLTGKEKRALILGTGGASKAVAYSLKNLGISFDFVSREGIKGMKYEDLDEQIMAKYQIIVNATPIGTYPNVESFPAIPYQFLNSSHLLYDLVYNPEETEFMKRGKVQGARTTNGLKMLYLQAEASWKIWNS